MIDIDTHRIIDIINSREQEDVVNWLKTFPNISIFSRDGSITYHKSISESHPSAIQVSDRFHLFKNLTSYAIEYLKKQLNANIPIELNEETTIQEKPLEKSNQNRKLTLSEKYEIIKKLHIQKKSQTQICKEINMDVRAYKKIISMSDDERKIYFSSNKQLIHEEKTIKKMEKVTRVRELKALGYSNRKISKEIGIDRRTVDKYLDIKFNAVHASFGIKRKGLLTPFITQIDNCLEEGIMGSIIEKKIREKGYQGSPSTIRHYCSEWKKRKHSQEVQSNDTTKKIKYLKRSNVNKLFFHPIDKIKAISNLEYETLCNKYPFFKIILDQVWSFKNLFKEKDSKELDNWIDETRKLNIKELNSFINGVERDKEAVYNAIAYPYSNGLAEGSINKLKVIKRIMFGRCNFETLKNKIIKLEKMRNFN